MFNLQPLWLPFSFFPLLHWFLAIDFCVNWIPIPLSKTNHAVLHTLSFSLSQLMTYYLLSYFFGSFIYYLLKLLVLEDIFLFSSASNSRGGLKKINIFYLEMLTNHLFSEQKLNSSEDENTCLVSWINLMNSATTRQEILIPICLHFLAGDTMWVKTDYFWDN